MREEIGRWEFDPERGSEVWRGPQERSEVHGPATVHFFLDKARRVEGCLLPNASRGLVSASFEEIVAHGAQPSTWRHRQDDGRYVYGRVEISPGRDVAFCVDESKRPRQDFTGRFFAELSNNARIRELLESDEFAKKLYAALCNVEWFQRELADRWGCTWRAAGGFVAALRGRSEEYIDFYLSGGEGDIAPQVAAELARLGWYPRPRR